MSSNVVNKVKRAMVIKNNGRAEFNTCASRDCKLSVKELYEYIPTFYSKQHAIDGGWLPTNDPLYSRDGGLVWLCPKCAKKRLGK